MKIKSLHISSFGALKNVTLDLEKPFNIIYGDNENGKTTIMNFIKMMFYGTERSSAQLSKNIRKKYTPWDNSMMAGSIDFENNNRNYRLERIFGSSNSTDKVTLLDLDLGTKETVTADIGTTLFGITAAAFERSIFIGQFGFPESNNIAVGELNGKLSNIALTGDETISFDQVNKRLENAKYELMSKSGRSGVYDKNLKVCESLKNELELSLLTESKIETAKQTINQMVDKINSLQQKADFLKEQINAEQDLRNAEKLKELLSLKTQLDELNEQLYLEDGTIADEMFVRKVEFCLSKIESIEQKITAKQNETQLLENNLKLASSTSVAATPENEQALKEKIAALQSDSSHTGEMIRNLEQKDNIPAKKNYLIFYLLALVFDIISIFTFSINKILFGISCALAFIFLIFAIALMIKSKTNKQKIKNELMELRLKETKLITLLTAEKANLAAISAVLGNNSAMVENQKDIIEKNKADLLQLDTEKQNETDVLYKLFSSYKQPTSVENIKEILAEIKQTASTQKELKQNINYILKDIGNISYDQAQQKLENLKIESDINFDKIKTEYEETTSELTELKTNVAAILGEIKSVSANTKNPDSIKLQIEELEKKCAMQKEFCDCIDIALSVLNDSYAEVRKSYGSVLEKKASEIFSGLTNGKYKNMGISKSFEITVEKNDIFGIKELDYLSSGTQDQAYLSLRLALSQLLSEDIHGLPIILDDALAQYDDTRTKQALNFLSEYAQNGQIIMFTCHNSILDLSKDLQINEIRL